MNQILFYFDVIFKFIHSRKKGNKQKMCLNFAVQIKFNKRGINKIESPHGIVGKNLHSINSAPSNSKTEATLVVVLFYKL